MERDYIVTSAESRDSYLYKGNDLQDYAIALEGEQGWIKLSQRVSTPPPRQGDTLHGIIENKQDREGNSFRKFKKVNPNFSGDRSSQSGGQDSPKLDYAIKMLEELTGRRKVDDEVRQEEDPFVGL